VLEAREDSTEPEAPPESSAPTASNLVLSVARKGSGKAEGERRTGACWKHVRIRRSPRRRQNPPQQLRTKF